MDLVQKVEALGESAQYDACNSCGLRESRRQDALGRWIYPAALPNGGTIRLLKVLLTNACEKNCYYCGIRARRDVPRTSFTPDELARGFDQMNRAGLVDGLFLSSAVCSGADPTMDGMIACVELLRGRYAFSGYVHLKLLPGCSEAHIERAVQLAHRVSVNLEAPNAERLARIAPHKVFFDELTRPMQIASRLLSQSSSPQPPSSFSSLRPPALLPSPLPHLSLSEAKERGGRRGGLLAPAGQTTQFVVGAAGESDQEILSTTWGLYRDLGLVRAYFSAFQPVPGTPLDSLPPTPAWREHRLYQADWLLRFYGFGFDDLVFDAAGNLPRQADPKRLYGLRHPEQFPVEVNRASRAELLRVPGIGPQSAARILQGRRQGKLRQLEDLARTGADAARAAPFVLLDGKRPPFQLPLWEDDG
jgi:putative DNA modification/repair radical SAM protein